MPRKRHTAEQIFNKLRQAVLPSSTVGTSSATCFRVATRHGHPCEKGAESARVWRSGSSLMGPGLSLTISSMKRRGSASTIHAAIYLTVQTVLPSDAESRSVADKRQFK
jgi:hypothetical protein